MGENSKQRELLFAIILAGVLIAGSLVFLGLQSRREEVTQAPIDEKQLAQKIKQEILAELQNSDFLPQQVEIGIQKYIQKQQEAQMKAQAEQERIANEKAKNVRRLSPMRDHIYGNPDAVISLIEYSDFECPFCKTFHLTAKQLVDAYAGKVNWVYRHYPLAFHNPGSQKEAEASECANELGGNEAFWKYTDAIYQRTTSNWKGFPIANLVLLAAEIGLDQAKFQVCLDSGKYTARVQDDFTEGTNSGISGTPGNILLHNQTGGVKLIVGALPVEALKTEIDQMLK
jgi:protein-disulfide isomerase